MINPTEEQRLLSTEIRHYVEMNATSCDRATKEFMSKYLSAFVINSVAKYERGQREHGGNLMTRNQSLEIYQETMDLFWYGAALREQQQIAADKEKGEILIKKLSDPKQKI